MEILCPPLSPVSSGQATSWKGAEEGEAHPRGGLGGLAPPNSSPGQDPHLEAGHLAWGCSHYLSGNSGVIFFIF